MIEFRRFCEFDQAIDGNKIIGFDGIGKIKTSDIKAFYLRNDGSWLVDAPAGWIESDPPVFFAKAPKFKKSDIPRVPSISKIENLSDSECIWYYEKDKSIIPDLIKMIKIGLIKKYYGDL